MFAVINLPHPGLTPPLFFHLSTIKHLTSESISAETSLDYVYLEARDSNMTCLLSNTNIDYCISYNILLTTDHRADTITMLQ